MRWNTAIALFRTTFSLAGVIIIISNSHLARVSDQGTSTENGVYFLRFFNKLYRCLLFLVLFHSPAFSTTRDTLDNRTIVVDSILILGNTITEPSVILNELTFKPGDTISVNDLKYNRERIYSLGLFNTVSVFSERPGVAKVYIEVIESWYIWPIPFIELVDHDWSKVSYGLDLLVNNFRGQNQKIRVKGAFGYNSSLTLTYENPMLDADGKYYLAISGGYGKLKNKSDSAVVIFGDDFYAKYYDVNLTLGKRFNRVSRAYWTNGLQYFEYPNSPKAPNFSSNSPKGYPYTLVSLRYDTRDLAQNAELGSYFNVSAYHKGFGVRDLAYQGFTIDLIHYIPLGNSLTLKVRELTKQVSGANIPYYDQVYLGYDQKVRGQFSLHREGKALYFGSMELKLPLIREWDIGFDFPLIPTSLQRFRTGLYTYTFVDAGTIHDKSFSVTAPGASQLGFGVGLGFLLLPYNQLRVELAFDKKLKREVIVDLGTTF